MTYSSTFNGKFEKCDPDETEGRALYRAKADALASAQDIAAKRRVKIKADPGRPVSKARQRAINGPT